MFLVAVISSSRVFSTTSGHVIVIAMPLLNPASTPARAMSDEEDSRLVEDEEEANLSLRCSMIDVYNVNPIA